ncbi:MAG: universal stress protein [Burkholderiales bacterium]|nr:universal stress protein [Burkholderiales bacterium]
MKILLAVDGSPYTKRMLAYLAAHDEWLGAQHEYILVHAVPLVPPRPASVLDKATLKSYYDDSAEKVLKPIRTFFERQGLKASCVSKAGPAAETIVAQVARSKPDLIVMGSHGHGALARLVLGSVAAKVMAGTKVPVLLVR